MEPPIDLPSMIRTEDSLSTTVAGVPGGTCWRCGHEIALGRTNLSNNSVIVRGDREVTDGWEGGEGLQDEIDTTTAGADTVRSTFPHLPRRAPTSPPGESFATGANTSVILMPGHDCSDEKAHRAALARQTVSSWETDDTGSRLPWSAGTTSLINDSDAELPRKEFIPDSRRSIPNEGFWEEVFKSGGCTPKRTRHGGGGYGERQTQGFKRNRQRDLGRKIGRRRKANRSAGYDRARGGSNAAIGSLLHPEDEVGELLLA